MAIQPVEHYFKVADSLLEEAHAMSTRVTPESPLSKSANVEMLTNLAIAYMQMTKLTVEITEYQKWRDDEL